MRTPARFCRHSLRQAFLLASWRERGEVPSKWPILGRRSACNSSRRKTESNQERIDPLRPVRTLTQHILASILVLVVSLVLPMTAAMAASPCPQSNGDIMHDAHTDQDHYDDVVRSMGEAHVEQSLCGAHCCMSGHCCAALAIMPPGAPIAWPTGSSETGLAARTPRWQTDVSDPPPRILLV
jgi:hypothetical protein